MRQIQQRPSRSDLVANRVGVDRDIHRAGRGANDE
jgi:hypothetical protein